jgi:hypothetical protein
LHTIRERKQRGNLIVFPWLNRRALKSTSRAKFAADISAIAAAEIVEAKV